VARSGRERERELTLEREVAGGPSEGEGLRVVSRLGDEGVVVVGGVEAVLVVALHRVLGGEGSGEVGSGRRRGDEDEEGDGWMEGGASWTGWSRVGVRCC